MNSQSESPEIVLSDTMEDIVLLSSVTSSPLPMDLDDDCLRTDITPPLKAHSASVVIKKKILEATKDNSSDIIIPNSKKALAILPSATNSHQQVPLIIIP